MAAQLDSGVDPRRLSTDMVKGKTTVITHKQAR